jgi:2-polyprenyl-3-methyl-5-hydroxy-6-metoxy-1,4-benzoquinol methylase
MNEIENIRLEDVPCVLGCARNDEILFNGHDLLHNLPGEYSVVRCRGCSLIRTNPRPTNDSIGVYYPDNYEPYISSIVNIEKVASTKGIKQFLKPFLNRIFDSHSTKLPLLQPGKMLEIGCASGSFLHHMARKGWRVEGIEFSEKAAKAAHALGYKVHVGALESAPQLEGSFDLIVGWMVLEHLHDPVGSLRKLREWAKPEAWLALSVPNAGSLEFKLFKDKGFALQLPTHLNHFTPKTLEQVLLAGGWRLEKMYHQRTLNNLIGSLGYYLRHKGYIKLGNKLIKFPEQGGLLVYILFPFACLMSLFGQTGRMNAWARPVKID